VVVKKGNTRAVVLFAETVTAGTFWQPTVVRNATAPFAAYYGIGTNETALVTGPYLVRNASISGETLYLWGDLNKTTTMFVSSDARVKNVYFNGKFYSTVKTPFGFLQAKMMAPVPVAVPKLAPWKTADSLPEVYAEFDDSKWTSANHTTTNNPTANLFGGPWFLFSADYGFVGGNILWRGHFTSNGKEKSVRLAMSGGQWSDGSVYLNGRYLGRLRQGQDNAKVEGTFNFPAVLKNGADNVVTVIHDHMGQYESGGRTGNRDDPKYPFGILGYSIDGGKFTHWKVQGNYGGNTQYPDKVRGVLNEGGLYAERLGWHLPGFNDSNWAAGAPTDGVRNATVAFYRSSFSLNVPVDHDLALSFKFGKGGSYRAQLYVNGWQFGKCVSELGPQFSFPVPQGIVDLRGENTVAVSLWSLDPKGDRASSFEIVIDGVYRGGVGQVRTNNPRYSPRQ